MMISKQDLGKDVQPGDVVTMKVASVSEGHVELVPHVEEMEMPTDEKAEGDMPSDEEAMKMPLNKLEKRLPKAEEKE